MKIYMIMIPLLLLLLAGCTGGDKPEETSGTAAPGTEPAADTAVITLSSFAGGGYEYTVTIDDGTVAEYTASQKYEKSDEPIDGASYEMTVTFKGLKEGSTTARIYGKSPIMENDNRVYKLTVDRELKISLEPVAMLSTFYLYIGGYEYRDSFRIDLDEDGYGVSISDGDRMPVSSKGPEALMEVIDKWNVRAWDGFDKSADHVLDGESFWLEFTLTDGTSVLARGDNVFPSGYRDASGEISAILEAVRAETE